MKITKRPFGELDGTSVEAYTLTNDNGIELTFITYGGTITRIVTPDRDGKMENIVLGFDTLEEYVQHTHFFGALIGRTAGRIGKGRYRYNGQDIQLSQNDGENNLHGGPMGFDRVIWKAEPLEAAEDTVSVKLFYRSEDGEEGYPGNLDTIVTYTLTNENEFRIDYLAEADEDTPVTMTNHSYFNLSGNLKEDILDHTLTMKAGRFLELSGDMIPTGKAEAVEGTPFDFRDGQKIAAGAASSLPQNVMVGNGYDHPFVLSENGNREIILSHEKSGRGLTIETDQNAVILYTGNHLTADLDIRGVPARKHLGLCLETQGYPDAVNHPHFPSVMLKKGDVYKASTTYSFHADKEQGRNEWQR
ncbi:aldose epimerase family protein [Bacillus marinisedimentorum]|uniref:aldose epimerase family protein n=1 Tax=Bacillus marinisedimentorum TaxID=1821260 RepID=UPI0007DFD9F5|nr:aldose epimerase family protein [Bacillus marinisedimentorum]